jgi:hypothetical protein
MTCVLFSPCVDCYTHTVCCVLCAVCYVLCSVVYILYAYTVYIYYILYTIHYIQWSARVCHRMTPKQASCSRQAAGTTTYMSIKPTLSTMVIWS